MNDHLTVEGTVLKESMTRLWESDGIYLVRFATVTRNTLNPLTNPRMVVQWGVEHNGRLLEWFDRRKDARRLANSLKLRA